MDITAHWVGWLVGNLIESRSSVSASRPRRGLLYDSVIEALRIAASSYSIVDGTLERVLLSCTSGTVLNSACNVSAAQRGTWYLHLLCGYCNICFRDCNICFRDFAACCVARVTNKAESGPGATHADHEPKSDDCKRAAWRKQAADERRCWLGLHFLLRGPTLSLHRHSYQSRW